MRRFELTFTMRDSTNHPLFHDRIESDSITHILSLFLITIAKVVEKVKEMHREERFIDDDIPF